jgi:hypothetical protein
MRRKKERCRGIRGVESRGDNIKNAHCTATVTQELGNEACKKRDI